MSYEYSLFNVGASVGERYFIPEIMITAGKANFKVLCATVIKIHEYEPTNAADHFVDMTLIPTMPKTDIITKMSV